MKTKISLKTVNGNWLVSDGEFTLAFRNAADAFNYIAIRKKAVIM